MESSEGRIVESSEERIVESSEENDSVKNGGDSDSAVSVRVRVALIIQQIGFTEVSQNTKV